MQLKLVPKGWLRGWWRMPKYRPRHSRALSACAPVRLVARWHKQWVRRLQQDTLLTECELRASFAFLDTADYREGLSAFLQKKKPQFNGR